MHLNIFFLNMGLSENRVHSQWNGHLIGIMISKTIGFRGLAYFQTNPHITSMVNDPEWSWPHGPPLQIWRPKMPNLGGCRTATAWGGDKIRGSTDVEHQHFYPWRIHGAGRKMLTYIGGISWWDPWHTIFLAAPARSVMGYSIEHLLFKDLRIPFKRLKHRNSKL